jgi:hypothetical protein
MVIMAVASNTLTTIPVHSDVVRRLRSLKTADQTWDDFLLEMASDYVPRSWIEELERRARESTVSDTSGEEVFRRSQAARRSRR